MLKFELTCSILKGVLMKLFKFVLPILVALVFSSCSTSSVNSKVGEIKVDYESKMILNDKKIPTIVFYYAMWCPYCKKAMPIVEQVQKEYSGKVLFYSIDVEDAENKKFVETFKNGQPSIPHFQFYGKKGNMMEDKLGLLTYEAMKQRIQANFKI